MEGRKRTVQVKFYVTEEERRLIREKMKLIPTRNMAAYLRKMAIDGYVVHIDTTDIRAQTAELQKIGVNVNQIARRLNSMGPLYTQDVADIKGALAQIWQLQRYILSADTSRTTPYHLLLSLCRSTAFQSCQGYSGSVPYCWRIHVNNSCRVIS